MTTRSDLPLTFWTLPSGAVSATRGGIRYRAERMGTVWLCTVMRGKSPPLSRGMAANLDVAQSWLGQVAAEIELGRRLVHRRLSARGMR